MQDDPTLRRCLGFARRVNCGSLEIVNLFAYRTSQPAQLRTILDPIGTENDAFISEAARRASTIILGWGTHGVYLDRDKAVLHLLAGYPLSCLGRTKDGFPKHPLYCSYGPLLSWETTTKGEERKGGE
jgi:hypothetical protein